MNCPRWLRRIAFVTCMLAIMCEAVNTTMVAALFPPYALELGLNETQVGFIVGMMGLANLIGQMTIAPVITPRTRKLFFVIGNLSSATSVILFGFTTNEYDPIVFFVLCVGCRFTMGIGAALVFVAAIPMVIHLYPEKAAIASSTTQLFIGLGGVIGAPIGSLLSTLAQYLAFDTISFPFYSFGGFQLCLVLSAIMFVPSAKNYDSAPGKKSVPKQQFYSFICHKNLWFVTMPTLLALATGGFKDVAYSPYFEFIIGVDSNSVGYTFAPLYIFYGISSILWGYLAQHGNVRVVAVTAIVTGALCPLLFFLPAIFPVLENLPYAISVSGLAGVTISAAFGSGYLVFEKVAEFNGFTNVEMNRLMAAGWYNCVRSVSRIIGAFLIGGVFLQQLEFYHTCLLHASLSTFFGIIGVWQLWKTGLFQKSYYTLIEAQSSDDEVSSSKDEHLDETHTNLS